MELGVEGVAVESSQIFYFYSTPCVHIVVMCYLSKKVSSHLETVDDPCKDSKYKEADVDAARAHKDEVHVIYMCRLLVIIFIFC